jgi:hypothetical protein
MTVKTILRHTLIIIIVFCYSPLKSQNNNLPSDSLSRFSYTIFGQMGNTPVLDMGTCSFIKSNENIFLITAKHVLYHCDSLTKKLSPKFNIALVYLPENSGFIQFEIPETHDSCTVDYKDLDLFIFKIDNKWRNKINTIEDFILPTFKKYGKMEIFGQGLIGDSTYIGFDKQHNFELKEKSFIFYANAPSPDSKYIDT